LIPPVVTPFYTYITDGTYDDESVSKVILTPQPDAQVIVPPYKTAIRSAAGYLERDNASGRLTNTFASHCTKRLAMACAI
jgi:hypothetical protein